MAVKQKQANKNACFFVICQKTPYTKYIYNVQAIKKQNTIHQIHTICKHNKKAKHHTPNTYIMCKHKKTNKQKHKQKCN